MMPTARYLPSGDRARHEVEYSDAGMRCSRLPALTSHTTNVSFWLLGSHPTAAQTLPPGERAIDRTASLPSSAARSCLPVSTSKTLTVWLSSARATALPPGAKAGEACPCG